MDENRQDAYERITARILELMERDGLQWLKGWKAATIQGMPRSFTTKKKYKGINALVLLVTMMERGYSCPYFVTFNQAQKLGGRVKKGEKGSFVVFFKTRDLCQHCQSYAENCECSEAEQKLRVIPYARGFTVFNLEQIDGIKYEKDEREPGTFNPISEAESIAAGYENGPSVEHYGGQAYYKPSEDKVVMPYKETFFTSEAYYSTLFHELGHSTGHKTRLDRGLDKPTGFGSQEYAKEELIAELTSAFLCAEAGLEPATSEQNAAYLKSWLKSLENDKRYIFQAASAAQKAADHIKGARAEPEAQEREAEVLVC